MIRDSDLADKYHSNFDRHLEHSEPYKGKGVELVDLLH